MTKPQPQPCTDESAEAAYIACVMARPEVLLEHPVAPEAIATRSRRVVLSAIAAIVQRRHELSTQSLMSELERMGVAPPAATDMALAAFDGMPVAPASAAKRLRELHEMRRRREQALRIVEACEAHQVDDARGMCAALGNDTSSAIEVEALGFSRVAEVTIQAFVDQGSERDRSVRLGTPSVDTSWHPYPGSLTVVGAQTGVGKSTLLTAWALDMAHRGIANGIVSAEDPAEDFGSKMLGELAQVDPAALWRGRMDADDMGRVIAAAEKKLPLSFAHVVSRKLDDVLAAMRLLVRKHGARVVMVDYLQTIMPRPGAGRDVRERTDAVLADLIVEAGALGVALVLASQLRRPERDTGSEPSVTALKESGTIENRAQAIVLLWREEGKNDVVHGKLAKVKRAPAGRRFDLVRNPNTGALNERSEYE